MGGTREYFQDRRRVAVLLGALVLVSAPLCAWVAFNGSALAGRASAAAGLAASLAALGFSIREMWPAQPPAGLADHASMLARDVLDQWEDEAEARGLLQESVIPLEWSATARPVADTAESVAGVPGARYRLTELEGRLHGDFDRAALLLARGYRRIPSDRLVVLGEPGSGKTVLAIMLVLGLLRSRTDQEPVPVLLSAASWDPLDEPLDDWIVGTVAAEYFHGHGEIPRALLSRGKLLPVLDGLDEMPEQARRGAVSAINEGSGERQGIVVTCRSAEYQDVIEGGDPVLSRAPVVEVQPLSVDTMLAQLGPGPDRSPPSAGIAAIMERLGSDPRGPLAKALSTPLMLSLARSVHRGDPGVPSSLLTCTSRHGAEDHLLDRTLETAYADLDPHGAEQARHWLTQLARHLHRRRERDLNWWSMSDHMLSRWTGPWIGIALGFLVLVPATVGFSFAGSDSLPDSLGAGAGVGAAFAVLSMIVWFALPQQPPGRLSFRLRGPWSDMLRGLATGMLLTAVPTLPVLAAAAVAISVSDTEGWSAANVYTFVGFLWVALALGGALGLALAVHNWVDRSPERSSRATPGARLRQDRASSLVSSLLAGTVLAVTLLPLLLVAAALHLIVVWTVSGTSYRPYGSALDLGWQSFTGSGSTGLTGWDAVILGSVGAAFSLLVLLTRAWPRFCLVRFVLGVRRKLPFRLMAFLEQARDRQILRQVGSTYQFRHARLQERLVTLSGTANDRPADMPRVTVRRRWRTLGGSAVLALFLALLCALLPADTSRVTLPTGSVGSMAFTPDGASLVTEDEGRVRYWDTESGDETGPAVLAPAPLCMAPMRREGGHACAGSADGRWVAMQETGSSITVRDTVAGTTTSTLTGVFFAVAMAVNAQGTRLTTVETRFDPAGAEARVTRWDITRRQGHPAFRRLLRLTAPPRFLALSDDGTRLAVAHGESAQVWDLSSGEVVSPSPSGPTSKVEALALSPAGRSLAVACADGTTRIWSLP
ncbi:hypothetical protein ACF1A5_23395 [Streptomyces sp. NPDC014864]|uniref:NACHT and WD40 repeat domain-containing protein n=1 Tax=Streptomyces sp. NPDC014864 TaxID=3364924 RepID=UPI003702BF1E